MSPFKKALCIAFGILLEAFVVCIAFSLAFNFPFDFAPKAEASAPSVMCECEECGNVHEYRSATIEVVDKPYLLDADECGYILDPTQDPDAEQPTLDELFKEAEKNRTAGEAIAFAKAAEAARIAEEERLTAEVLAAQEEIEDDPVPMAPAAYKPGTISFLGTTNSYVDSFMSVSAPARGAGLWWGSDSVLDGELGFFIGHNPGDFYAVMDLSVGDTISVCDRSGYSCVYGVVDVFTVPDTTYLEDILDRIDGYGESICVQTCVGDKANYRLAVADAL